jgi:hypothetical protein
MIDRMKEVPDELYHLVGPAIYRNSKRHWSGVVHDSNDRALKTLQEISEELFAVHCNDETEVKKCAFSDRFTFEDAIGSHTCSLQASRRVTNGIPLGCPLSYQFTL